MIGVKQLLFQTNEIVKFPNKTGVYVGKIIESDETRSLLEVVAVVKHPKQGDLHSPNQADVPFFHQRKALANKEKVRVPNRMIKQYNEEAPAYLESLKIATKKMREELSSQNNEWAIKSLAHLEELEKTYFKR